MFILIWISYEADKGRGQERYFENIKWFLFENTKEVREGLILDGYFKKWDSVNENGRATLRTHTTNSLITTHEK